jgi:hypothetical protein
MPTNAKLSSRRFQLVIGISVIVTFIMVGVLLGTSSQGDSSDTYPKGFRGNTCTIETETLTIGYSSYYLTGDYQGIEGEIRTPYMPVPCDKIPQPGMLNIAIDLLHPDSVRNVPLALRLVKINAIDEETFEEHDVLSIPAQTYPSGVITQAFRMDEIGDYIVYLDGTSPENIQYLVQVPVSVGHDWKDNVRNFLPPVLRKFF